ncbi:Polyketide cyclase / dehydrase and lipid transport [Nonomuraea maritima]|uniref:Polyketide cyclase / dehydrase and lipid transport n=1 Tax=Nonomuraea maritima TaxID=683260 RepID=A0A1G8V2Y9_9ACTN|nr:SRPBCC family protein [Nonomuraea maritima]SDJ59520.1 Polyketide cyclase / dehydrase and lipid transport [Nonomuraea maritima]
MKVLYAGPSIERLHEEYAKKGRLDEKAPVRSSSSVVIDAPVARVWRLLADMHDWPQWRSDAHVVELGEVRPDAAFRWKIRGMAIKSTFAVVAPERELTWTGTAMGFVKAVDRLRLEETADGRTRVTVEESMSGPFLTLLYSNARLREGHDDMLRMLRTAAES